MTTTLADLTARTGLDVLDHLEQQVSVPVIDGLQAQGDLIVVPAGLVPGFSPPVDRSSWEEVPAAGLELLRSASGGNPHTLVADGGCLWARFVNDPQHLALGAVRTTRPAYLLHPEHGGTGIAPGTYLIRRQREGGDPPSRWHRSTRLRSGGYRLVAD
ncbi:hypothetical protein [Nocardiopsis composta]|uniref:Uncharacterized protein n=1 Tax=Nocardiopsis composta TaxID=157465 RepID=A0A7W8QGY3_9ACTN|nr:hypothetical protein [Nocardiopsis composta]MBB5430156.1 hypothetical protein [Nocardiopsis composta]